MPTIVIIGVLVAVFVFFASVYADVLWFNQLGFGSVFWTENLSKVAIFAVAFLIMGFAIWISMRLAYRSRPVYAPDGHQQDSMSRYQSQLEPMRRLLMIGVPVVIGIFAATAVTSQWKEVLLFFNQVPFADHG